METEQEQIPVRHPTVMQYLQRAWQDKYEPYGQGPRCLTAPEMKKIRTTLQTPLLDTCAFTSALEGVPAEDWCRT
jgi:hypothetical protein